MNYRKWIPKSITQREDFLPENLEDVRSWVWETIREDIAAELYVYENRVLLSPEQPIAWETIRRYEYESKKKNKVKKYYEIQTRDAQICFLRAWVEVERCSKKDKFSENTESFLLNTNLSNFSVNENELDFFLLNEQADFSFSLVKKIWNNCLNLRPSKRKKKYKYIDHKKVKQKNKKKWNVYVRPKLRFYFYGLSKKKPKYLKKDQFSDLTMNMETIKCKKDDGVNIMLFANFDSWLEFIFQHQIKQGNIMLKDNKLSILESIEKDKKDASKDKTIVTDDIHSILQKIENGTLKSELSLTDRKKLDNLCKESPKVKLMLRRAHHKAINKEIAQAMHIARQKIQKPNLQIKADNDYIEYVNQLVQHMKNGMIRFVEWMSPPMKTQYVELREKGVALGLGADFPPETKTFNALGGEISVTYLWRKGYQNKSGFLNITWKMDIIPRYELWIVFVNPSNHEAFSEFVLGEDYEGEKYFSVNDLKFDPSIDFWSAYLTLKELL